MAQIIIFLGKTVFSRTKNSEKLDLRILKLPLVPFCEAAFAPQDNQIQPWES